MGTLTLVQKCIYAALVVLGLSFWFFLGFPFANHNESFVIVTQLDTLSLGDILTEQIYPVATYRPLGQAVAWSGYHMGEKSVREVQIFNFVVAVIAWLVLFFALRERRVFAFAALAAGGVFFSGYIYLFHLHGVFYSPLLLLIAVLFLLETKPVTAGLLWVVSVTALVATFFHTYALPIYLAALVGFILERPREFGAFRWTLAGSMLGALILLVALVILPRHESVMTTDAMLSGLLASYRMVEVNGVVSATAALLAFLTAWSYPGSRMVRWILLGAAAGAVAVASLLGLPMLFVWIGITLVKTLALRKWWLSFVIAGTALLPAPAATGSPTYLVFTIMACAGGLALFWSTAENRISPWGDRIAALAVLVAVCLLVLLRQGVDVPVLSEGAKPLLAEREKTFPA